MSNLYDIDVSNDPDVIEAQGLAGQAAETLIVGAQVTGAISSLNGLAAPTQLFATSGGITVSSVGNTHTFSFSFSGTLAVANGGTGATTASGARTNLGAAAAASPAITPATITLAKITGGGTDGSITVSADGVITAYVAPT